MPKWILTPITWIDELSNILITELPIEQLNYGLFFILIYFFPFIIHRSLSKKSPKLIFSFNLIFGHMPIGWFIVLIWVIFLPKIKEPPDDGKLCPHCKELIRYFAKVCPRCHTPCGE